MEKFHILFKKDVNDLMSTGKNYQAPDIISAIEQFEEEFPDGILLAVYTAELTKLIS